VTDSICASGSDPGDYNLSGRTIHVDRGEARLADSGDLAGGVLPFNKALRHANAVAGLPLHEIVKTTSWNQARSLGIDDKGKIEPGYAADLVLLDRNFELKAVFLEGMRKV
jgi:N-acetylglucosamine-6-phosphate deacetylase